MRLSVQPADGLADEPLRITLAGVPPASEVTVAASAADADGARWGSEARFEAGGDGSVDLERHAPKAGTYDRTDPMGLLWSMRPPHEEDAPRFAIPWDRFEVAVEARADAQHARATVIRRFAAGGVERVDVVDEAMRATLFLPPGPGPHPAISLYHGSGGGIPGLAPSAALLASHGFAALVVGYFGVEGTPPTLCEVALESLAAGVRYLGAHPRVDPSRIGALGTSVGAEGVLAMASFIDDLDLRAVIGVSPSSVVWQALAEGRPPNRPRWTLGGAALPYARIHGERLLGQMLIENPLRKLVRRPAELHTVAAYEAGLGDKSANEAVIPVERIGAPLLLMAGENDEVWPAQRMAQAIAERRGNRDRLITYPDTGHISLRPPGTPTTVLRSGELAFGGTPGGFFDAMRAAWPEVVSFAREHIAGETLRAS